MRLSAQALPVCVFVGVFMSTLTAQADGDVVAGEKLAWQVCARCHNVERSGPSKQYPPSFASIAVFRSPEQIRGKIIFPPLHSSMPQLGTYFTPDNVNDLVAYITSLENQ